MKKNMHIVLRNFNHTSIEKFLDAMQASHSYIPIDQNMDDIPHPQVLEKLNNVTFGDKKNPLAPILHKEQMIEPNPFSEKGTAFVETVQIKDAPNAKYRIEIEGLTIEEVASLYIISRQLKKSRK